MCKHTIVSVGQCKGDTVLHPRHFLSGISIVWIHWACYQLLILISHELSMDDIWAPLEMSLSGIQVECCEMWSVGRISQIEQKLCVLFRFPHKQTCFLHHNQFLQLHVKLIENIRHPKNRWKFNSHPFLPKVLTSERKLKTNIICLEVVWEVCLFQICMFTNYYMFSKWFSELPFYQF